MATQVTKNFRPGRTTNVHKFGRNTDVDSGGNEDIIEQGGLITYDAGGTTIELVSSEAADTAKEGWVEGVDLNYDWVREKFTTNAANGTTAVELETQFYSIYRARLQDACAGQITFRKKTGPSTRLIIAAGYGGTLFAGITIPRYHQAEVNNIRVETSKSAANDITAVFYFLSRPVGEPWVIEETIEYRSASILQQIHYEPPRIKEGPIDLRMYCSLMSASDVRVSASIDFDLINKVKPYQQIGPTKVGF